MHYPYTMLASAGVAFIAVSGVRAQDTAHIVRDAVLPEVVVTAAPFSAAEQSQILVTARVLRGDELHNRTGVSLGETLSNEPGVSATAFGAAASRPVIRGLGGPRVRVLQNGMGISDVSTISEDHAVGVDPYSARQIEILRGPAALLHGSGASAGVVNLVNARIPAVLEPASIGEAGVRVGSVDRSHVASLSADGSVGNVALHFDSSTRNADDYRIPGRADRADPDAPRRRLPNSSTRQHDVGFGASLIEAWGYLGASVSALDARYRVPSHEGARIDMQQRRFDIDGLVRRPTSGLEHIRLRVGQSRYDHTERNAEGEPETDFSNDGTEARLEFAHGALFGWRGTFGVHAELAEFAALPREEDHAATVPRTRSRAYAAFLVEERDLGPARVNAGMRAESARRDPDAGPVRSFDLFSWSVGAAWTGIAGYSFGPTFSLAQRAPTAEELYSAGPHHATETFDRGDAALGKETSRNVELTLQKTEGLWRWRVNLFRNRIDNFIYGRLTGAALDHHGDAGDALDERVYSQAQATIRGAEAEVAYNPLGQGWSGRLFADTSRGRLGGGAGNLPLQPAARVGIDAGWRQGPWRAGASLIRAQRQDRLAAFEAATPGYTRIDANVSWTQSWQGMQLTWFAQARNLLDEDIRLSTSLLKEEAPLAGRGLVLGLRTIF